MSAREPLWFCHECHAEMRPLMVPDPVCASCHGSFVEKMENPSDDPREFAHDLGGLDGPEAGPPQGVDALLFTLQSIMDRGIARNTQRENNGPAVTFEVRGPSGTRTVRLGGGNTSGGNATHSDSPGPVPNMSTFLGSRPQGFGAPPGGRDRPDISGPVMAQYLMALLGQHDLGVFGAPESGRMGDYVFNQEALDQIITQIMENSNAHRPVPATEEITKKLPREVLMEGSATLEQDCAVCKEQFKLQTEDPDEQVVVTLPCKHPFHEPCITPWLKSSGTCPVCRYALVPQPEHHPPPTRSPEVGADSGDRRPNPGPGPSNRSGSGASRGPEPGGLFQSIFGGLTSSLGHHNHNQSGRDSSSSSGNGNGTRSPTNSNSHAEPQSQYSQHRRSNSDPAFGRSNSSPPSNGRQSHNGGNNNVPGSWSEDLD